MVYSQESVERGGGGGGGGSGGGGSGRRSSMSERSAKPLHNFSLPRLKWGCQKHLRCVKVGGSSDSSGEGRSSPSPALRFDLGSDEERLRVERRRSGGVVAGEIKFKTRRRGEIIDCDKEIGAVREKFMIDLRAAMDKMRDELLGDGAAAAVAAAADRSRDGDGESGAAGDARPWNLRTRRAACKAPTTDGGSGKVTWSVPATDVAVAVAGDGLKPCNAAGKPRFAATLKRKEIEDDFVKMTGQRPPRRPKRRPRAVQKQVETLFPAFWSTEAITAEMYKVHDFSDNIKR